MVCYDFCAGFALRALCWEVWEDCIDLEGGVGQGDEKKVFWGGEAGEGGGGLLLVFLGSFTSKSKQKSMWRVFTLMLADRDSSFVSPRGRQQQQVGRKEAVSSLCISPACLPLQREGSFTL